MTSLPTSKTVRLQTLGEEIANSISHGIGALLALIGAPFLIYQMAINQSAMMITATVIFCWTIFLLYITSTLYHALAQNRAKWVFQILDHSAIFFLIAGTYTPFCLGVLKGWQGWSLFIFLWGLTAFGTTLKGLRLIKYPWLSTLLYLVMGWSILFVASPLFSLISPLVRNWLIAGGIAYTAGVIFFVLDEKIKYFHFIRHLFVLTGTICHFFAVYFLS